MRVRGRRDVLCCAFSRVAAQIRSLRNKLKDSRSTVEQLTTELSSVKIAMHEREAEMMSALRSSTERLPGSAMGTRLKRHSLVWLGIAGHVRLGFVGLFMRMLSYLQARAHLNRCQINS